MNKEIKEILDCMKEISEYDYTTDWFELDFKDTKILLDYITNLQERIDKAIEYIEQYCIDDEFYVNLSNKEKHIIEVLNILKGVEDEKE